MQTFLIFSDAVFLIAAVLFLFFPKAVVTLSKLANQVLVYTDEKIYDVRKAAGVVCLILAIFLTTVLAILCRLI